MKHLHFSILLAVFMSMTGAKAWAYDIAVKNEDGVTLYYNYINDSKELEVTYYTKSSFYNENTPIKGDVNIPETVIYLNRQRKVTRIREHAFDNCSGLTSVTIPNSVTSIGVSAFNHCSGLTSVTIGNSVTSIGAWAFVSCGRLTSVTIPNSVTSIGKGAFSECHSIIEVRISDLEAWCNIDFDGYASNPFNGSKKTHLYLNDEEVKDIIIPEGVTRIRDHAFYELEGLTSVTIPNSVTSIGFRAFAFCRSLTSVTIGNSLTTIGEDVFYECSLKKVIVKDIAAWCNIDFRYFSANPLYYSHCLYSDENTEITDLVIPNSVTSIGYSAFVSCSDLTSVTIPNSVNTIGAYAFSDCI